MIEVSTSEEIEAPAEAVWAVLTELEQFGSWNPFIRDAHGSTEVGGTVHVRVRPSLGIPLAFHAEVTVSRPDRELRWRGQVLSRWLAAGDHTFEIEPINRGRVRFVQRERFSGLLPWLASKLVAREALRGFEAMNLALAARAREWKSAS
ncbi:MAG: SRPBCC domain-containing protein [Myxococcales bacterium]|nr:SRPBCC domain-containing protein [Myxococcales bacterium]